MIICFSAQNLERTAKCTHMHLPKRIAAMLIMLKSIGDGLENKTCREVLFFNCLKEVLSDSIPKDVQSRPLVLAFQQDVDSSTK